MKKIISLIILVILLITSISCNNLQQDIEDKAKEIHESADKQLNKQLLRVDSTMNQLDSGIQKKIDGQLDQADSLIDQIHKSIAN
jgi:hypothetical protein